MMKRFIIRLFLFLLLPVILTTVVLIVVNRKISYGNYFAISPNANSIIVGHSHPATAFNDSLIDDFKNFAQPGESYFYTYYKLKKIIENNQQVKTVFIEVTNNQISKDLDNWIWDDKYVSYRYPKYSAFMTSTDLMFLFTHNPGAVLNAIPMTFKNNYYFLKRNRKNYINETEWGAYLHHDQFKTDSILIAIRRGVDKQDQKVMETSSLSVEYLQKIIKLCDDKLIKVYFVRSPLHPEYTGTANETEYRKTLNTKFSKIDFLDFKDFPLTNNEYADLEHLNYKGAKIFSLFFNKLIKDGLLKQADKQAVIKKSIEMYNAGLINH